MAPSIAVVGAASVNEGATYTLTLGAVTDPGTDEVTQYVVNWGDGKSDTYTSAGDVTHVYASGAVTRSITVDLIDEDGTHLGRADPLSVAVNATPADITLSHTAVDENQPAGTVIDAFRTTDPDAGDTFSYTLVGGAGDTDNASFTIDDNGNLKTAVGFDYETQSSYSIRVRSTDAGGLWTEKALAVRVTNVNEAPVLSVPGTQTAYEDVAQALAGVKVGDPEGDGLTVTLSVGHGKLTLGTTTGLTVGGNGTASVTLSGGLADLNAALARLLYRGRRNYGGPDALSITAADSVLSTGSSVDIVVKSAAQQAADLRARVDALRAAGVLNRSRARRLTAKLDLKGPRGDPGNVRGFLDEVKGLLASGVLTRAQADALRDAGNVLLQSVTRR